MLRSNLCGNRFLSSGGQATHVCHPYRANNMYAFCAVKPLPNMFRITGQIFLDRDRLEVMKLKIHSNYFE